MGNAFIYGDSCNSSFCLDFEANTNFHNQYDEFAGKSEFGFVTGSGQVSDNLNAPDTMQFFLTKQNGGYSQATVACSYLPLGEVSFSDCSWTGTLEHPGGPFQPDMTIELWASANPDDVVYFTGELRGDGWDEDNFLRIWVTWDTINSEGTFSIQARNTFPEALPTWMLTIPESWYVSFDLPESCGCDVWGPIAYSGSMADDLAGSKDGGYTKTWPGGTNGCLAGCSFTLNLNPRFSVWTWIYGSYQWSTHTYFFDGDDYIGTELNWFSNPWVTVTLGAMDRTSYVPNPQDPCVGPMQDFVTLIAEW